MWLYRRVNPVSDIENLKFISFVGAGGKTSFIKYLAKELVKSGKKVAITTTTRIYAEAPYILWENKIKHFKDENMIFIGKSVEEGKLTGLNEEEIEKMSDDFDVILIEADGAKRKPIKFPNENEPVIPRITERLFVLAGLDALFKRIKDTVFRWQIFCKKLLISEDAFISPDVFLSFFTKEGLLKDTENKNFTVILNKYDACVERNMAFQIAKSLIRKIGINDIYIASVSFKFFYKVEAF